MPVRNKDYPKKGIFGEMVPAAFPEKELTSLKSALGCCGSLFREVCRVPGSVGLWEKKANGGAFAQFAFDRRRPAVKLND